MACLLSLPGFSLTTVCRKRKGARSKKSRSSGVDARADWAALDGGLEYYDACPIRSFANLFAFNRRFGRGHLDAHQAAACVQVKENFQVWRTNAQGFVFRGLDLLRAHRFHRYASRGHVLRNQDGKHLLAASFPIV